jgi:hypothetical protein
MLSPSCLYMHGHSCDMNAWSSCSMVNSSLLNSKLSEPRLNLLHLCMLCSSLEDCKHWKFVCRMIQMCFFIPLQWCSDILQYKFGFHTSSSVNSLK